MTDALPDPLTPPDCDLSSMDWFPFFHRKLRRSTFWLNSSVEIRALSVELWCEAFSQTPAASLPDDDVALSDAAGFGRFDLGRWTALKPDAMKAWTLCSDRRWYHPFLAKVALEAFSLRLKDRARKGGEAGVKAQERLAEIVFLMERVTILLEGPGSSAGKKKPSTGKPPTSLVTGQDRTGKESKTPGADAPVSAGADRDLLGDPHSAPIGGKISKKSIDAAFRAYCVVAEESGLPIPAKLTPKREGHIRARLGEHGDAAWAKAIEHIRRSAFLRGETGRAEWRGADIDWLSKPTNFLKVLEGKYHDGNKSDAAGGPGANSSGTLDVIQKLRAKAQAADAARTKPLHRHGGE